MAEIKVEAGAKKATPPRRETPIKTGSQQELREEAANGFFQLSGMACVMFGQFADAGAISVHGPGISEVAAKMANTNELIAKGLDSFLQVGPYAELVGVVLPLAMQLLVNHKVLPLEKMANSNVVDPAVLESQVRTQMARQAIEAMKMQRAAEEELELIKQEMMAAQNGSNPSE